MSSIRKEGRCCGLGQLLSRSFGSSKDKKTEQPSVVDQLRSDRSSPQDPKAGRSSLSQHWRKLGKRFSETAKRFPSLGSRTRIAECSYHECKYDSPPQSPPPYQSSLETRRESSYPPLDAPESTCADVGLTGAGWDRSTAERWISEFNTLNTGRDVFVVAVNPYTSSPEREVEQGAPSGQSYPASGFANQGYPASRDTWGALQSDGRNSSGPAMNATGDCRQRTTQHPQPLHSGQSFDPRASTQMSDPNMAPVDSAYMPHSLPSHTGIQHTQPSHPDQASIAPSPIKEAPKVSSGDTQVSWEAVMKFLHTPEGIAYATSLGQSSIPSPTSQTSEQSSSLPIYSLPPTGTIASH